MDTQPAAETEGKSQRVLQPEAERDGSSGVRGIPNSSTYPVVGDPGDTHHGPEQGQGGGERWNRMSGVRALQAPMPWLRTQRWTQRKEKWGLSWADLLRDCPFIWVPLCFPNSHLPLKATNVPTPLPSPTELPTDPVPVTEWGD